VPSAVQARHVTLAVHTVCASGAPFRLYTCRERSVQQCSTKLPCSLTAATLATRGIATSAAAAAATAGAATANAAADADAALSLLPLLVPLLPLLLLLRSVALVVEVLVATSVTRVK
jgi:hypothetical protein